MMFIHFLAHSNMGSFCTQSADNSICLSIMKMKNASKISCTVLYSDIFLSHKITIDGISV